MGPRRITLAARLTALLLASIWTFQVCAAKVALHPNPSAPAESWSDDDEDDWDGPTAGHRGEPIFLYAAMDPFEKATVFSRLGLPEWRAISVPHLAAPSEPRFRTVLSAFLLDPVQLDGFPVRALAPPIA